MSSVDLTLVTPVQAINGAGPDIDWNRYDKRFLCQGDSHFSIGSFPPSQTTSLLVEMQLPTACIAVNCAHPGDVLEHMSDTARAPQFVELLRGFAEMRWDAILLSGGGNDLIDALLVSPSATPERRVLATPSEWMSGGHGAQKYISEPGWQAFAKDLEASFQDILHSRSKSKRNQHTPVVWHTYDLATPRPSGAGLEKGPWLYKAVNAYSVPETDWPDLAATLLRRLGRLIKELSVRLGGGTVHVVDTQGTLTPAMTFDAGPTKHWQNEIHPTKRGYALLADVWERELRALLWPGLPAA